MDTSHYCNWLYHNGLSGADKYGAVFDPGCVENLNLIIKETGAEIVISSSRKDTISYEPILQMWEDRGLPGFVTDTTPKCSNYIPIGVDLSNDKQYRGIKLKISYFKVANGDRMLDDGTFRREASTAGSGKKAFISS